MLFNYQLKQLKEESENPLLARTYRMVPEFLGLLWVNRAGQVIRIKLDWKEAWHLANGANHARLDPEKSLNGEPVFFSVEDYSHSGSSLESAALYSEEGINLSRLMNDYESEGATVASKNWVEQMSKGFTLKSSEPNPHGAGDYVLGTWLDDIRTFYHLQDMVVRTFISKTIHYVNGLYIGYDVTGLKEEDVDKFDISRIYIAPLQASQSIPMAEQALQKE